MAKMANYSNDGRPQARALGIPLTGAPGEFNAITDVAGLEVGNSTIIRGEGPLAVGQGPVRTGVTAVLPRGRADVATDKNDNTHAHAHNLLIFNTISYRSVAE